MVPTVVVSTEPLLYVCCSPCSINARAATSGPAEGDHAAATADAGRRIAIAGVGLALVYISLFRLGSGNHEVAAGAANGAAVLHAPVQHREAAAKLM